jgi:hypothetical protein
MASTTMFNTDFDGFEGAEGAESDLTNQMESFNPYTEDMAYSYFPDPEVKEESNINNIMDEGEYIEESIAMSLKAVKKLYKFNTTLAYILLFDMYTLDKLRENIANRFVAAILNSCDDDDISIAIYLDELKHRSYFEDFQALDSIYYLEGDDMLQRYFAYAIVNALQDEILEHFVSAGAIVSTEQLYFALMMVNTHLSTVPVTGDCEYVRIARFLLNHGVNPDAEKLNNSMKHSYQVNSRLYVPRYSYEFFENLAKSDPRFKSAEKFNRMPYDIIFPLCTAEDDVYFDLVKLLVESDYKLKTDLYDYPLVTRCVVSCRDITRIEYFVENGALIHVGHRDRRIVDGIPHSPLIAAFFENRVRLADYFLSKGLDINWQFSSGHPIDELPLHIVIKSNTYEFDECINAMAIRGVDILTLNRDGYNVFDIYLHKVYDGPYRQRIIPKALKAVMNIYIRAAQRIKRAFEVEMQSPEYIYGRIKRLEEFLEMYPDSEEIQYEIISAISTWKSLPYHSRERREAREKLFSLVSTLHPFTPMM